MSTSESLGPRLTRSSQRKILLPNLSYPLIVSYEFQQTSCFPPELYSGALPTYVPFPPMVIGHDQCLSSQSCCLQVIHSVVVGAAGTHGVDGGEAGCPVGVVYAGRIVIVLEGHRIRIFTPCVGTCPHPGLAAGVTRRTAPGFRPMTAVFAVLTCFSKLIIWNTFTQVIHASHYELAFRTPFFSL